jgi:hypothetical protein
MVRQQPPELRCCTLTGLIILSAALFVLFRIRNNTNYPDSAVMPMFAIRGGPAAGQGGALAA